MGFPEEFLHFIWQFKLYGAQSLYTTDGQFVEVLHPGLPNKNAGPDFSQAKLKIAGTTWVGNVELHLIASDWLLHRHQLDAAYENVILHVVYEHDVPIYRRDGSCIPALSLKGLFPSSLLNNYEQLLNAVNHFPCEKQIGSVDALLLHTFLPRVLVARLEQKSALLTDALTRMQGNWDEVFYHFMARNFGFKVNAVPMELLAQSLPQQLFAKHKDSPIQIEALIFGQAGFLDQRFKDDYPKLLKREYQFLKQKYKLKPIDVSLWKFMRMWPQNFPTLRLAQFAALVVNSNHLFSKVLVVNGYEALRQLFTQLPVHPFWEKHYHFNKPAANVHLQLGKSSVDNILINTLSLFLFAYGKAMDQAHYVNRSFDLLEHLPPEKNASIAPYIAAGVAVKDAFASQALLQLKKTYCNEKKCLNCGIGLKILKP